MKKKRTLNQTWTLCLRMWKWIASVWETDTYKRFSAHDLKRIWLKNNGFVNEWIYSNCFFCDYTNDGYGCDDCPGLMVDSNFHCSNLVYNYEFKPVAFYKELLRLNMI